MGPLNGAGMRGRRRPGPPLGTPATPGTVLTSAIVGTDPYDPGVEQGADGIHSRPIRLRGGGSATVHLCRAPLPPAEGAALGWFLEGAFGADEKPDLFVTVAAKGLLEETARNDFAWADIEGAVVATRLVDDAGRRAAAGDDGRGLHRPCVARPGPRAGGVRGAARTVRCRRRSGDVPGHRRADGCAHLRIARVRAVAARADAARRPLDRGRRCECLRRGVVGAFPGRDPADRLGRRAAHRRAVRGAQPVAVGVLDAGPLFGERRHARPLQLARQAHVAGDTTGRLAGNIVSERGALVGSAPLEPYGNERAVRGGNLDLFVHPAFRREAPGLLSAVMDEARRLGWRWLGAELGEADIDKRALLEAHGFRVVGRREGVLEIAGAAQDVVLLRADLAI